MAMVRAVQPEWTMRPGSELVTEFATGVADQGSGLVAYSSLKHANP